MNESMDQFRQELAASNPDLSDTTDFNEVERQLATTYRELWKLSTVMAERTQTCESTAEYVGLISKSGQVLAAINAIAAVGVTFNNPKLIDLMTPAIYLDDKYYE